MPASASSRALLGLLIALLACRAWGMSETARVTIAQDGKVLPYPLAHDPMVVDGVHHVAYLGTDDAVVKLDLATFQRLGSIPLDPAVAPGGIASAAIDTAHGFAYFGTIGNGTVPGYVLRLDLASFSLTGTPLALSSAETHSCPVAALDPAHGFGYFGTGAALRQVDLSTFTFGGSFSPAENVACAAVDATHGFLYTGGFVSGHGVVIKLTLPTAATFTRVSTLALTATIAPASIEVDAATASAYLLDGTLHGATRLDLATFAQAASLAFPTGFLGASAGFDAVGKRLYVAGQANPGSGVVAEALKLDASSGLSLQSTITRSIDGGRFIDLAVDAAGGEAYFASSNNPCQIHRIDLASFAFSGAFSLAMRVQQLTTALVDSVGGHAYFVAPLDLSQQFPFTLVKVALPSMAVEQELILTLADDLRAPVIDLDAGYLYLATFGPTTEIVRIRLSDLTVVDRIPLAADESLIAGSAIDPSRHIAYFIDRLHNKIVRVGTAAGNFARLGSFQLPNNPSPTTMVVDPATNLGYLVTTTSGTKIARIDLATGQQVGAALGGFSTLNAGALDPVGGAVVFVGSQIAKVRLSTFTATIAADRPAENLRAIAIDAAQGLGYAASEFPSSTGPWLGQVSLIRLSDLARLENLTMVTSSGGVANGIDPTQVQALAIDPAHGAGYFGTVAPPSQLVTFTLNTTASGGTTTTGTTTTGTTTGAGTTTAGSATGSAATAGSTTAGSTGAGTTTANASGGGTAGAPVSGAPASAGGGGGCGMGGALGALGLVLALQRRRGRHER